MRHQSQCRAAWKTWRASPINSTVCVGRLLWILLCWMWQVPLAWHWESDRHGALSCVVVKTVWPVGDFVYKVERKFCITIVTAIVLALRSLIKTESRTAKLRQVESHCQGFHCKWTSKWMNTNLCSFALCQLVPSWFFLSKCSLLRKKSFSTTLHVLALKLQGTWMVPSNDPFLRKQTSEKALKPN